MLLVLPVATVWVVAISSHQPGDSNGIVIAIAILPVLWLVESFIDVWRLPIISSELVDAAIMCISGMILLGVVGLIQDLLRVPKPRPIVAIYLIATLVSFLLISCIAWILGPGFGEIFKALFMVALSIFIVFPNIVFLFGVGSIAVYMFTSMIRAVEKQ